MDSPLFLHVDGLTNVGVRRPNNEDAWWIGEAGGAHCFMEPGPEPLRVRLGPGGGLAILLVSDGVGGANAGEVASQLAVRFVSSELSRTAAALADPQTATQTVLAALHKANTMIRTKAVGPELNGMGATLSMLCFAGNQRACWGQVGDSRIYVCREGRLCQISRDHSPVGRLRQEGRITEAEARSHPLRHQIDQSLGDPNNVFQPDSGIEAIRPGDVYLLCSDGLSDGLWDREVEEILVQIRAPAHVRPAVRRLVARAKQASGRDNITAVVALVEDPVASSATLGTAGAGWLAKLRRAARRWR